LPTKPLIEPEQGALSIAYEVSDPLSNIMLYVSDGSPHVT
jgi:hypothetical protein